MTAAVLTAADTPPPPDDDGLPPGQPYVSPDDLASIPPLFEAAAQQALLPLVAQIWSESAGKVHAQLVDAADLPNLPSVSSLAAETYLAQAANTFAQVGDDLWNTARSELLAGFQAGESIPQLSQRLRNSAGLTARKATLVARTQVLDASNAGSYATAQASGLELRKGWLDTPDARTRPTHRVAGETYGTDAGMIPLADQFMVGGYSCDRPHDPTLPAGERYSCRCALIYSMGPAAVRSAQEDAAPVAPVPNTSGTEVPAPILPVEMTPAEVRQIEVENSIRAAYRQARADNVPGPFGRPRTGEPTSVVMFPDIRSRAAGISPDEFDAAINRMYSNPTDGVSLFHQEDQKWLTPEIRAAAVRIRYTDVNVHGIQFRDPSPLPMPARATVSPAEAAAAQAAKISEATGNKAITRQLEAQAKITPRAMADLDSVHIPGLGTPDGDAYLAAKNGSALGYYSPLGSHPSVYATTQASTENPLPAIWFNPHWNGQRLREVHRKATESGWFAPSNVNSLGSTFAHEYGHHVTQVLFEAPNFAGTADIVGAAAQRILGPINDALGANRYSALARNGDLLEAVRWGSATEPHFSAPGQLLDEWVRQNHDLIAAKVSGYAATNFDEFLAEVWREYSTMGAGARPHIQTIGALLRDVTEELRAGGATARAGEVVQLAAEQPLSAAELAAKLRTSRKGRTAMAQTEYRYTGNLQANKDLFPDAAERQEVSDAFAGYRGIGSSRTNQQLREGGFVGPRVASMDKAFAKSHLKDDVVVYRGARGTLEFGATENWPADLTGRTWTEKAFTSTSYDPKSARPFASDGVFMRIFAPRGTSAVGLSRESIPGAGVGEGEILLNRGMTFRVLADHRDHLPDGISLAEDPQRAAIRRVVDVEVVPGSAPPLAVVAPDLSTQSVIQLRALAKERGIPGYSKLTKPQLVERLSAAPEPAAAVETVAAEVPLAKRRITELRTLAKQRGLTVPPRATKADLIRALEAPPKSAAEQLAEANAAKRAAARERNKLIEQRAAAEQTLAELDDLLFKKALREAFEQRIALAQLDPADLAALRAALGDPIKLRAQVTRISKKQGISAQGKAGAKVKYDPAIHDPVGEVPPLGTPIVVIRRGSTITVDGEEILLNKAVVKLPTAPARKAAVKAAPKKAAPPARGVVSEVELPPKVAQLPRTGKVQTAPANAKATNPNYGSTSGNGNVYRDAGRAGDVWTPDMGPLPSGAFEENCSNVVHAFEMRMRGFDVHAAPLDVLDKYGYAAGRTFKEMDDLMADTWRLPDGSPHGRSFSSQVWRSFAEIDDEIDRTWPDGARGFIFVGKHIFNVVKVRGKAQYVEAQFDVNTSRNVTALYKRKYKSVPFGSPPTIQEAKLIRVDDLVPTDAILRTVTGVS